MKRVRATLWITIAALLVISAGIYFGMSPKLPDPIVLQTEDQPTIGDPSAKVHIVAFLDPKCVNSKKYHHKIYPMIKERYIDSNKARYTVILVSFIPNSMPTAAALLCAYNQSLNAPNPELFMRFLSYIYNNQPKEHLKMTSTEELLELAIKASPEIRTLQLKNCLAAKRYDDQIVENTEYEKKILGQNQAPVLFINGIRLDQVSAKNVNKVMKVALLQHGETP
jgi:protein-disulfide isomerase